MSGREYRFKFYLNARHKVNIDNVESSIHPHTWEIVLYIRKTEEGFIHFAKIESEIKEYLAKYEGKYLNEIAPFNDTEPYMENLGEVINGQITGMLCGNGWELRQLDISENPSRTYIITNEANMCEGPIKLQSSMLNNQETLWSDEKNKASIKEDYSAEALNRLISSIRNISSISKSIEDYEEVTERAEALEKLAVMLKIKLIKSIDEDELYDNTHEKQKIETIEIGDLSEKTDKITDIAPGEITPQQENELAETEEQVSTIREEDRDIQASVPLKVPKLNKFTYLFSSFGALAAISVALVFWLTTTGMYPWGSDSWYHLFKGHMLYKSLLSGDFYPLYNTLWYNGIEPLRYWAPFPHYVLAGFELVTGGNTAITYNIFIGFIFLLGAFGWILWGQMIGRRKLAMILAIFWFFLPDNLRVMFSEGNLSRVTVSAIFPYLLLCMMNFFEKPNRKAFGGIFGCMLLITFCHAMIAAMVGITVFVFSFIYGFVNKKIVESIKIVAAAAFGVLSAGIWLYPALKGGLVSMDQESVKELMRSLTYNITESLNPILKLNSPDSFYFGVSILIIAVVGLLLGGKRSFPGFMVCLLIFTGTTKAFLSMIEKLPLSQLFWMMRFTPLALGLFFVGLLYWKNIRKIALIVVIILISVDCIIAFNGLCHNSNMPKELRSDLDKTIELTSQRTAVFDLSEFGSFPSYYLSYNSSGKNIKQVFGSGWQGARTSQNIMWLNTAFEKGWYSYMLDRSLEMGADTVLIKKDKIKDMDKLNKAYSMIGYKKVYESRLSILLKMDSDGTFATKAVYKGLGIGKYAVNISFLFPQVETGESPYIDDYSEKKLSNYSVIYLSGFKYRNKLMAEAMVKNLSQKGIRFVIDLTNAEADTYTSKPDFLNVIAQPVEFNDFYPDLKVGNMGTMANKKIPTEYSQWKSIYLENLDRVHGSAEFNKQEMDFLGTKTNENIKFIGFNLPFYTLVTGDSDMINMIQSITGLEFNRVPERKLVNLVTSRVSNSLEIAASEEGVITGISDLDSFKVTYGKKGKLHNLITMEGNKLVLETNYPYAVKGLIVSIIGVIMFLILAFCLNEEKRLPKLIALRRVKQDVL